MKPLLDLMRQTAPPKKPPIWFMRQAGRYLPEYRAVREQTKDFLQLCYNPELAAKVSLQPITRFGFDGCIVFADILLLPHGLGQKLWFEEGEGPRLTPISSGDSLSLENAENKLMPICETLRRLSRELPRETTLIGFAGAPWTVATYMIAGRGNENQAAAKKMAKQDVGSLQSIIDMLVIASIDYLVAQAKAGAEILMLFESWAGALRGGDFENWCIVPVKKIIEGVRRQGVNCPIIAFPRGADYPLGEYAKEVRCDILGLGTDVDRKKIVQTVPEKIILQGNLDPQDLFAGGEKLDMAIDKIIEDFSGRRFIFNLGHGVLPQTPPAHVAQAVARVRNEEPCVI